MWSPDIGAISDPVFSVGIGSVLASETSLGYGLSSDEVWFLGSGSSSGDVLYYDLGSSLDLGLFLDEVFSLKNGVSSGVVSLVECRFPTTSELSFDGGSSLDPILFLDIELSSVVTLFLYIGSVPDPVLSVEVELFFDLVVDAGSDLDLGFPSVDGADLDAGFSVDLSVCSFVAVRSLGLGSSLETVSTLKIVLKSLIGMSLVGISPSVKDSPSV